MREIKFRAWDLMDKKMDYAPQLHYEPDANAYVYCRFTTKTENENAKFHEGPLMQFTGLKDKNGKEIYEGDIVRYDLGDREAELEGEENRYDYAQIVFDNGQFLTLNHDGSTLDEIVGFGQENQWEVIGNIYENPELLDSK